VSVQSVTYLSQFSHDSDFVVHSPGPLHSTDYFNEYRYFARTK